MVMRKTLLALLLAAGVTPALAQEKTFELKLSHWVPASHPLQKSLEDWGAAVEKASGGTIKYKVYPAQQLGKAFDHYDMARDGIADVTYVNPGYQPGRFPIIGAGELPFLMSDRQEKAIDDNCNTETAGRVGEPWGKFEDAGVDKVKAEAGHEVYKLTPEQTALWKKASEPLIKTWADGVKKTGTDPDAAMTELRAALAKYNAVTQ